MDGFLALTERAGLVNAGTDSSSPRGVCVSVDSSAKPLRWSSCSVSFSHGADVNLIGIVVKRSAGKQKELARFDFALGSPFASERGGEQNKKTKNGSDCQNKIQIHKRLKGTLFIRTKHDGN